LFNNGTFFMISNGDVPPLHDAGDNNDGVPPLLDAGDNNDGVPQPFCGELADLFLRLRELARLMMYRMQKLLLRLRLKFLSTS